MSFKTVLVQLGEDDAAATRLRLGRDLARRFEAQLIGLHVLLPPLIASGLYGEAAIYAGPQLLEAQRLANAEMSERVKRGFERPARSTRPASGRRSRASPPAPSPRPAIRPISSWSARTGRPSSNPGGWPSTWSSLPARRC